MGQSQMAVGLTVIHDLRGTLLAQSCQDIWCCICLMVQCLTEMPPHSTHKFSGTSLFQVNPVTFCSFLGT